MEKLVKGEKLMVKDHDKNRDKCDSEEPSKHAMIITCMDSRINPLSFGDFKLGQVYVFRNGGGKVSDDAVRSTVLAIRLFAIDTIFIVQHTDCGLEKVSDTEMRHLLYKSLGPAHLGEDVSKEHGNRDKNHNSDYVAFLAFTDLEKSVIHDVFRLRQQPLISERVSIFGYIYNVETHKLYRVKEASSPGKVC